MDSVRRWGPSVAVHLILGVVAIVPLWLSMMFATNYPLAELGLTSREPTDNDGMLPWAMILVPVWAVFLALWLPVGALARPKAGVPGRRYWAVSSGLLLTPMVVLMTLFVLVDG
ncbi:MULTISPECIES: hypothetical protein [Streptomyces]|uniref:Integral membrane protein n=1 Tax=Streptomyces fimbriatus TaxID=68197 RepID=A0ABW0DBG6_STRFI|nr:hypothetical protein [Streptomyces sp.]